MPSPSYTLAELSDLSGLTPRTVRYYVQNGLLPPPRTLGPRAKYDEAHLGRLRLIRQLQRRHLPLAEIRTRLDSLDEDEIVQLSDGQGRPAPESAVEYIRSVLDPAGAAARPAAAGPPALNKPAQGPQSTRSQWERLALTPDVELHVRRPLTRHQNRQVERLVALARQLLEEDST